LRVAAGQGKWQLVERDGSWLREMAAGGQGWWQQVVEGGGVSLRVVAG